MSEINVTLSSFTDVLAEDPIDFQGSQPLSLSPDLNTEALSLQNLDSSNVTNKVRNVDEIKKQTRPAKGTGQYKEFRSVDEIESKYRCMFSYPYFNLVQSRVIEDALYSDKSMVVCAPTGSGKTVVFEMAIVQLLMEFEDKGYDGDFKIIYMAPVKSLCTERLTEWYPKLTKLGLLCIEVTGDTDVDFSQLKPYRVIITTPEKWDILTRRWTDYRGLVEVIKLFLIDEVHILNDETRGPVLEAVVSRMKAIESSSQSAYRIERLQKQYKEGSTSSLTVDEPPKIRFVAVSATVSNPEDVAAWLGNDNRTAVFHKYGEECRPVKLKRVVEGYPCPDGTSIFKFDIILNYKLWPIIQKHYNGKPTLIFVNTRKSVFLTAEALAREVTVSFSPEQKAKLTALASKLKNKKLQMLVMSGVGCHHAGLLFEERTHIEQAFRERDLPILITTTTLAMGVNLPAHLVIIKNTQQYVNGAYQEYSISTVLQMVGRAGRPQFDTEATAVIMTRMQDKARYQSLVGGSEPLQSYLHKRLAENLNCEAALHTVTDVAQCVQWLRSTFLYVRAAKDPKRYLGLPNNAPQHLILKKVEELCVKAMNGLASSGLITMDEASCIEATEAGRLMSVFYLDFDTMKKIMKIEGSESLEQVLWIVCESHELSDMHLRMDERRCLNALNRNNAAATIRFPMKGKVTTRQMKLNCLIQSILGCLPISDPSLTQEAMKITRIAERVCKCMVAYVTRADLLRKQPQHYSAVLNAVLLEKCVLAHLWENSPYLSRQLKGIGPTFSTLLATAGKVTFMQIEESHPRDLERIMNKGPPAGNILHKQVTLLPKYQLTMTPIDEKSVSIQLMLLNQHFLLENIDNLTAGMNHKCYIIVGDSENFILHFNSFKDRNLLQMYDGIITLTIQRMHRFEHKIFAHCISCNFVGIDANCEYLFKNLDQHSLPPNNIPKLPNAPSSKKPATKQTSIKDTYKERKRRSNEPEISQSKEKKRRESSVINKFMALKKSFGNASKEMKQDVERSLKNSTIALDRDVINLNEDSAYNKLELDNEHHSENDFSESFSEMNKNSNFNSENLAFNSDSQAVILSDGNEEDIEDSKIDSILNDIESEINGNKGDFLTDIIIDNKLNPAKYATDVQIIDTDTGSYYFTNKENNMIPSYKVVLQPSSKLNIRSTNNFSKASTSRRVDNYKFIELIEKNTDLSDEDNQQNASRCSTGFSRTIQNEIQKFLSKAQTKLPAPNILDKKLLCSQSNSAKNCYTKDDIGNVETVIEEPRVTAEKQYMACNTDQNTYEYKNVNGMQKLPAENNVENSQVTDVTKVIKSLSLEGKNNMDDVALSCSNASTETVILKEFQSDSAEFTNTNQLQYKLLGLDIPPPEQASEIVKNNSMFEDDEDFYKVDGLDQKQCTTHFKNDYNNKVIDESYNVDTSTSNTKFSEIKKGKCGVSFESNDARALTLYNDNINIRNDQTKNSANSLSAVAISNRRPDYALIKSNKIFETVDSIVMPKKKCNTLTETQPYLPIYTEHTQIAKPKNLKIPSNPQNTFKDYDDSPYEKSDNIKSTQNFSYKAQKVDIWNKSYDNKKCSIKVIQNIKIDVDITKTIKENTKFYNNGQNNQTESTSSIVTNQKVFNNLVPENDINLRNKPLRFIPEQLKPINITDKIILDTGSKTMKNDLRTISVNGTGCIVANNVTRNNILQDTLIKRPVIESDNYIKPSGNDKNNIVIAKNNKPTTIADVLQKYVNIFRNKSAPINQEDKTNSFSQTIEAKTLSHPKQPKKLFKIKDMPHIEIDLTKVLDSDTAISYPILPIRNEKNYNVNCDTKKHNDVAKVSHDVIDKRSQDRENNVNQQEQITVVEENSDSPPQSDFLNEVTESEYKMDVDQSMLNPKTLLQCLGEDNLAQSPCNEPELIPPPPEFCDYDQMTYSPSPNNCTSFEKVTSVDNKYYDDDDTLYEKGFQDDNDVETWTLSPEKDEIGLPYSNELSESADSASSNDPFSVFAPRKTKLNNFKLIPKPKLRKY